MTPDDAAGQTPLDPNESDGLLVPAETRADLDRFEQENITKALAWLRSTRNKDALSEAFLRTLHTRMFGLVWAWAGQTRRSDKSIGIDWRHVDVQLRQLVENTRYQIEHSVHPPRQMLLC